MSFHWGCRDRISLGCEPRFSSCDLKSSVAQWKWTPTPHLLSGILSVHKPSPSSLDLGQRKEGRSFSSQEDTDKYRRGKALSLSHSTKNSTEEKLCSENWMYVEAGGRGQPRDGWPIAVVEPASGRTARVVTSRTMGHHSLEWRGETLLTCSISRCSRDLWWGLSLCQGLKALILYFIFKKEPVAYGVNSIKEHVVVASLSDI